MGKKRAEIKKIPDSKLRYKAFIKRKRGLMKKAIELSMLCGVKIFLGLINPDTDCTTIYQSDSSSMRDIMKSLQDNLVKKEFINSHAYSTLFDPHYVKLLNRLNKDNGLNNNGSFKVDSNIPESINDASSQLLKSNMCSLFNTETEINHIDLSTPSNKGVGDQGNMKKNIINNDLFVQIKDNGEKSSKVLTEHSLQDLNVFISESKDLNQALKFQLSTIEEFGCYSNDFISQLLNSHISVAPNEIDFYKWLADYSSSLNSNEKQAKP